MKFGEGRLEPDPDKIAELAGELCKTRIQQALRDSEHKAKQDMLDLMFALIQSLATIGTVFLDVKPEEYGSAVGNILTSTMEKTQKIREQILEGRDNDTGTAQESSAWHTAESLWGE